MHHAVTVKEVVAGDRLEQRVGTVPDVNTINAVRDSAGDREVVPDCLFRYRGEIPGNLNTWVGGFREWLLKLPCD